MNHDCNYPDVDLESHDVEVSTCQVGHNGVLLIVDVSGGRAAG